jgi:hypothetical protein
MRRTAQVFDRCLDITSAGDYGWACAPQRQQRLAAPWAHRGSSHNPGWRWNNQGHEQVPYCMTDLSINVNSRFRDGPLLVRNPCYRRAGGANP